MRIWNSSFSDSIEVRGVSSLNEVLDHVRNDYHVPPSVPLNIALVEDGTIVDDDEYFGTLARNSELVFLSPWEKFNPWLRKLRDAFSRDPQISSMERVVGDFLSQKREAKTKLLNSYVSRLPVNRSLNSREEDPSWFQGLPGRFKSKDQVMKDRARSRMRNYLRETKEYLRNRYSVNEKEVQFSFSIIRELTDMLKERDYHGHYFNREELARDLRLCDSHGSFKCQGPFNSDICSYVDHQINPYDNRESLILFQNWNLDHGIEKSRTILPGMIQAMKSWFFTMALSVLELFSGIGGMHCALKASAIDANVVAAADIHPVANAVYSHNFPSVPVLNKNIESFDSEKMLKEIDLVTMSPPCQPFSRLGLQRGLVDARTKSLVAVIEAFRKVKRAVPFIFLENVKGFEESSARELLLEVLKGRGYFVQEFLLSPVQFGICNSRLRYYLLARTAKPFPCQNVGILTDLPEEFREENSRYRSDVRASLCPPTKVQDALDSNPEQTFLSDACLRKHTEVLDIVNPCSTNTCCFTKAYSRYFEGTGSVLAADSSVMDSLGACLKLPDCDERLYMLRALKLRFFTPSEVARFMCFPKSFGFPASVTDSQKHKLLGNSVNVFVVGVLLKFLIDS